MLRFLVQRLLAAAILVWLAATATFFAVHAAPGDVTSYYLDPRVPASQIERLRSLYGLDRPLLEQYFAWLSSAARADFGVSPLHQRPVSEVLVEHAGPTIFLGVASWLLAFAFGIGGGLLVTALSVRLGASARSTERLPSFGFAPALRLGDARWWLIRSFHWTTLVVYSLPSFWIALMAILVFGRWLGWLPISGMSSDDAILLSPAGQLIDRLRHVVLPATILALPVAAYVAQVVYAGLSEQLLSDHVRAARARGLSELRIHLQSLLSCSGALLQIAGLWLRVLLGGAVVVEFVFGWPGLGRITAAAIQARDVPLVVAATLLSAVLVVLGTLAADLAHAAIDPRVRAHTLGTERELGARA